MGLQLKPHQIEALEKMKIGCILKGGVGSGKSITSLAYYFELNGGEVTGPYLKPMVGRPKDLYIITTARKRDTLEWIGELTNFSMFPDPSVSRYKHKIVIDSWNNIKKYVDVKSSFFIFDEQRVIGYGAWTKSFLKIAKHNDWVLLTATPGDTWSDYIPVFIANGHFRNKSDFYDQHAVFSRFSKYPMIERYINEGRLLKYRNDILIEMQDERHTIPHHETIITEYDRHLYNHITKTRWNVYKDKPIETASEFCFTLRRVVNSDYSRVEAVHSILLKHPKAIIFYSYDYELDILRGLFSEFYDTAIWDENRKEKIPDGENWLYFVKDPFQMTEWNGHKHEAIPDSEKWVYLVEYIAGSEGWNCIVTDTIIFYSQNYSFRTETQAAGRIDRMNTPFTDLFYFHFRSNSKIDMAIRDAYKRKKRFNEMKFAPVFKKNTIDPKGE